MLEYINSNSGVGYDVMRIPQLSFSDVILGLSLIVALYTAGLSTILAKEINLLRKCAADIPADMNATGLIYYKEQKFDLFHLLGFLEIKKGIYDGRKLQDQS